MRLKFAFCTGLLASSCSFAQPSFPNFTYYVPAVAEGGGPVYVIPGTVTEKSKIGFTVSGQACVQGSGIGCFNAAGVVTVKGSTAHLGVGQSSSFTGTIGGFKGTYKFGALLLSIDGVGTVQVFPANAAHGLGSSAPPDTLTLPPTTFARLGFHKFTRHNAQITLFVADNFYPDNSQGFQVGLAAPSITYDASAPTRKLIQVNGPCDWAAWDLGNGPCYPTAATDSRSEVLGNDEGNSFVDTGTGELIFLFGDTIGVQLPIKAPPLGTNIYPEFHAADAIATAPMPSSAGSFTIGFFPKSPKTPQFVKPSPQPGKPPIPVAMGADDVPDAGIHINGKNYIMVHTGSNTALKDSHQFTYSVLVEDEGNTKFTSGRTISISNAPAMNKQGYIQTGHFTLATLAELPLAYAQQLGLSEPGVLMAGEGEYRAESIYLAYMPSSALSLAVKNNNATRYFTGLDASGVPQWSATEMDAVPVVYDNPTGLPTGPGKSDPGTVGDTSLRYFPELGLWLMTWDGGRQSPADTGIYFSAAPAPWGPWSAPQLVYNPCEAHRYGEGYGDFIHYVVGKDDPCNGDVDDDSGPAGPIIGTVGDPFYGTAPSDGATAATRRGAVYAPYMVPGLTSLDGGVLSVDYNMSTWNPYAVVLMESNFNVKPPVF